MFEFLLFDLDGTIIDSREGVTKSTQYALSHVGIDEPDLDKLICFIGPPPKQAFEEYYGLTGERNDLAVSKFRENYRASGIRQYKLFPGIPALLGDLRKKGVHLSLATTKHEESAAAILDECRITQYFDAVVGAKAGAREEKISVCREAMRRIDAPSDKSKTAIVGDRKYDAEGAQACGISCVGVGYGFAPPGELEALADYVVPDMDALRRLLLGEE